MDQNHNLEQQNGFHSEAESFNPLYPLQSAPETTPLGDLLKLRKLRDDIVAGIHPQFQKAESNPDIGYQKHVLGNVRSRSVEGRIMSDGIATAADVVATFEVGSTSSNGLPPVQESSEIIAKVEQVDSPISAPFHLVEVETSSLTEPTILNGDVKMEILDDGSNHPNKSIDNTSMVVDKPQLDVIENSSILSEKRAADGESSTSRIETKRARVSASDNGKKDNQLERGMGPLETAKALRDTRAARRTATPIVKKLVPEKLETIKKKKEKKEKKEKEKKEKQDKQPEVVIESVDAGFISLESTPSDPSSTSNIHLDSSSQHSSFLSETPEVLRRSLPVPPPLTDLHDESLDASINDPVISGRPRSILTVDNRDSRDKPKASLASSRNVDWRAAREKDDSRRKSVEIMNGSPPPPPPPPPRRNVTHGNRWAPRPPPGSQNGVKDLSKSYFTKPFNDPRLPSTGPPPLYNRGGSPIRPLSAVPISTLPPPRKVDPRGGASRWAPTTREGSSPNRTEPPRPSPFSEGLDARSFLREYDSLGGPPPTTREDSSRGGRYFDAQDSHSRPGESSSGPRSVADDRNSSNLSSSLTRNDRNNSGTGRLSQPLLNRVSDRDSDRILDRGQYALGRGDDSRDRGSRDQQDRPLSASLPAHFGSNSAPSFGSPALMKSNSRPNLGNEKLGRSESGRAKAIVASAGRDFPPPPGMEPSYDSPSTTRTKRPYVAAPLSVTIPQSGKKTDTRFNYTAAQRPDIRPASERPGYVHSTPVAPLTPAFDRFDDRGPSLSSNDRYSERSRGYTVPREEPRSREDFRAIPSNSSAPSVDYRNGPLPRDGNGPRELSRDGPRDSRDGPRDPRDAPRDSRDGPSREIQRGDPRDGYYQDGPGSMERRSDLYDDRRGLAPLPQDNYPRREYAADERMEDRRSFIERPNFDDGYGRRDQRREIEPRGSGYDERRVDDRRMEERRGTFPVTSNDRPVYDDRPLYAERPLIAEREIAYDNRSERRAGEFDRGGGPIYDSRDRPPPFDDRRDGPPTNFDHRAPLRQYEPPPPLRRQFDEPKQQLYENEFRGPPTRREEPSFNYVDSRAEVSRGGYANGGGYSSNYR